FNSLCEANVNLGSAYLLINKTDSALYYAKKGLEQASQSGNVKLKKEAYHILNKVYDKTYNSKQAYFYYKNYVNLKDSLFNAENVRNVTSLQNKHEFEKEKNLLEAEQEKKDALQAADLKRQKAIRNTTFGGLIIVMILAIVILRSFIQKRKANQILEKQKEEIQSQNKEINQQKEELQAQAEELKTTNDQLLELDNFKQSMTSMIVHDLKNPLNTIINTSDQDANTGLKRVKNSGMQMLNMVLNILDVHKYEESQLIVDKVECSLNKQIELAINEISFLSVQKSIIIDNGVDEEFKVLGDEQLIKRILVNLLTNAIKYSPQNEIISINTNFDDKTQQVAVRITDKGDGIPKEQQISIFEQYQQVSAKDSGKVRSTGLGLTFCKLAVEAHGGNIGIESEPGKGCSFWFTLPIKTASAISYKKEQKQKNKTEAPFTFDNSELEYLQPYTSQLQKLMVYEATVISKIIDSIKNNTHNIETWKKQLSQSVYNMNEDLYKKLLEVVSKNN
ncbi:MAG: ATP-binding protein, partial [Bacteroidales bacterium]|nr:ATP-binding protein [Bacteroidales bacterium]